MHAASATSQGGPDPTLLLTLPPLAGRLDPYAAAYRACHRDTLVAKVKKTLHCLALPCLALVNQQRP